MNSVAGQKMMLQPFQQIVVPVFTDFGFDEITGTVETLPAFEWKTNLFVSPALSEIKKQYIVRPIYKALDYIITIKRH